MCILCVIQRCSRKVATMLPWLVVPLIGLWALSQLLPPPFRFEVTSPRVACVSVLVVTLLWYEILMPWLSAWRVRRNDRLRERKRFEAIELQKLRKTATRRCRNCSTAYRDQNPGAGKFMCSYCGHISKRPVLDLPVPPGMGASGIFKGLMGKGGKILNGKAWSDNGWMYGQDWLENGNWVGGPLAGKPSYRKSTSGFYEGTDYYVTDKSYSRIFIFSCRVIASFFLSITWLWRKIFRVSSSEDDVSDAERRDMLDKQGENGATGQESRGEKARRKAEEKRQARIEKELLEEEERKQREEVARLVEERRRLRDEKTEAEKERGRDSPRAKEVDSKKEAEKKRQERKKERDRWSSKSNSDAEELEKRNKKSESDKHRSSPDSTKAYSKEVAHGFKSTSVSSQNKVYAGTRYLDRMRGTLLSSSRVITGGGFFGKGTNTTGVTKEHKPNLLADHVQTSTYKKDVGQPDCVHGRSNVNGDEKGVNRPAPIEPQPAPKRSWQQLFTRSTAVSPLSNSNMIGRHDGEYQAEVHSPTFSNSTLLYDKPLNFGLPSPFNSPPYTLGSTSTSVSLPLSSEAMFPRIGETPRKILPEESEIFEDPCYIPDPISLLGSVYESLDTDVGPPFAVKTGSAPPEITKPSPIESPLSRSRVSEEWNAGSFLFPSTPKGQENSSSVVESGGWQMWDSSPLGQDGLGSLSWLPPSEQDFVHTAPQKTMASLFKKDEKPSFGTQNFMLGNGQKFNSSLPMPMDDPWLPKVPYVPSINDTQLLMMPEEAARRSLSYGSSSNHQFEMSATNSWATNNGTVQGPRDGVGNYPIGRTPIGGIYPAPPDVHSLWS